MGYYYQMYFSNYLKTTFGGYRVFKTYDVNVFYKAGPPAPTYVENQRQLKKYLELSLFF